MFPTVGEDKHTITLYCLLMFDCTARNKDTVLDYL
jgi:hypothetical protein